MKLINLTAGQCKQIQEMPPDRMLTYIRDVYCQGYEDAKHDRKILNVDMDMFRERVLAVRGISRVKLLYILEILRECMTEEEIHGHDDKG